MFRQFHVEGNAVGKVRIDEAPTLVFCAHLDTVGTAGMTIPPFEPEARRYSSLWSRQLRYEGHCATGDVCAAAALARDSFPQRLLLALVANEEYASIDAQDFVATKRMLVPRKNQVKDDSFSPTRALCGQRS